ncbi:MAG: M3 family oligoendopeptidase [Chitinophagales bacterium]
MNFKNIEYKRIDMNSVQLQIKNFINEIAQAKNQDACFHAIASFNDLDIEVKGNYFLAYVRHTLDFKDDFYKEEKQYYSKQIPILDNLKSEFYAALLKSPFRENIGKKWGKLFLQIAEAESLEANPVFIESNQKLNQLFTDFFQLRSGVKIHVRGKDYTMKGIGRITGSPNRAIRKEAYDGFWKVIERNASAIEDIFQKVLEARQNMTEQLGYENFMFLGYKNVRKYDYGPKETQGFRAQVLQYVTPLSTQLAEQKRKRLGYEQLYHYDGLSFKTGDAKLKEDLPTIIARIQQTFQELSTETVTLFEDMIQNNWIDFSDNPKKLQGANFCGFFPSHGYPFINVFFFGRSYNLTTIFHEFGHAFQKIQSLEVGKKWGGYFWAAPDIAEIHSTAMEYFTWNWYPLFFGEDTQKFRYQKLTGALNLLIHASIEDEFQHLVYGNPNISIGTLGASYRKIEQTYRPDTHYDDNVFLEQGGKWHSTTHVTSAPFHYISYALSTICALQFWKKSQEDFEGAWQDYLRLCKVGGSVGFNEALQIANLKSPFEEGTLKEVVGFVQEWLDGVDTSEW